MNKDNCLNCNGNQLIRCINCINKYSNENFNNMINLLIENRSTYKGKKKLISIFNNPKMGYISHHIEQRGINLNNIN